MRKNKFLADGKQTIRLGNDEAAFRSCQANSNQLLPPRAAMDVVLETVAVLSQDGGPGLPAEEVQSAESSGAQNGALSHT